MFSLCLASLATGANNDGLEGSHPLGNLRKQNEPRRNIGTGIFRRTHLHRLNTNHIDRLVGSAVIGLGLHTGARSLLLRRSGAHAAGNSSRREDPLGRIFSQGAARLFAEDGLNYPTPAPVPPPPRTPPMSVYIHVPQAMMKPEAWENVQASGNTIMIPPEKIGVPRPPSGPPPLLLPPSAKGLDYEAPAPKFSQGFDVSKGCSKKELLQEMSKAAAALIKTMPEDQKSVAKATMDKLLQRLDGMPKDQFLAELRNVGMNYKMRALQKDAAIHEDMQIREETAQSAPGGRLAPRTMHEVLAHMLTYLIHPLVPLTRESDERLQRATKWISEPFLSFLTTWVVRPLLTSKLVSLGYYHKLRGFVFWVILRLAIMLPPPIAIVIIKFVTELFGPRRA